MLIDETWPYKGPEFIFRRHILYDRSTDSICVIYPDPRNRWRTRLWVLPVDRLTSPRHAAETWGKLSARSWGTEHVVSAVRRALECVLSGNLDNLRITERKEVCHARPRR